MILAINCGSSSLKWAQFDGEAVVARGAVDGTDHAASVHALLAQIARPSAVGHRLVHGGPHRSAPVVVDARVLVELGAAVAYAPLHLPAELAAIHAVRERLGNVPQVACFDTAFHRTLPEVARRFALPLSDPALHRYGFHGLSYEYVAGVVGRVPRAIFAHLGSGASMVAVRDGHAIDTTMGFTPAGGLVMGTRPGDVDPGLLVFLLEHRGYDVRELGEVIERGSGLLALSGTTASMQQLLARRVGDPRAALAVDVFCYQARKCIGAYAAALGGLDTLAFTGGIGERSPEVRAEICKGLGHLGIALDEVRNSRNAFSVGAGACVVRVVPTDEELVIARHTRTLTQAQQR